MLKVSVAHHEQEITNASVPILAVETRELFFDNSVINPFTTEEMEKYGMGWCNNRLCPYGMKLETGGLGDVFSTISVITSIDDKRPIGEQIKEYWAVRFSQPSIFINSNIRVEFDMRILEVLGQKEERPIEERQIVQYVSEIQIRRLVSKAYYDHRDSGVNVSVSWIGAEPREEVYIDGLVRRLTGRK